MINILMEVETKGARDKITVQKISYPIHKPIDLQFVFSAK